MNDGAIRVLHLSKQSAGRGIEGIDDAISKVADEQFPAEFAKASRGQGYSPRGIEDPSGREATNEVPLEVELGDETPAGADHWIMLARILLRVSYENAISNNVYSKCCKIIGNAIIVEASLQ